MCSHVSPATHRARSTDDLFAVRALLVYPTNGTLRQYASTVVASAAVLHRVYRDVHRSHCESVDAALAPAANRSAWWAHRTIRRRPVAAATARVAE